MAHFKRGNLQLKTNQIIKLGDTQEVELTYDGAELTLNTDEDVAFNIVGDIFMGVAAGGKGGGVAVDIKQSTGEFNVGVADGDQILNIQSDTWNLGRTGGTGMAISQTESARSEWGDLGGGVKIKLDSTGFKNWIEFWAGQSEAILARIGPDPTESNPGVYLNTIYPLDSTTVTVVGDLSVTGTGSTTVNGDFTVTGDIYCDDLFTSGDTIHVGTGEISSVSELLTLSETTTKIEMDHGNGEFHAYTQDSAFMSVYDNNGIYIGTDLGNSGNWPTYLWIGNYDDGRARLKYEIDTPAGTSSGTQLDISNNTGYFGDATTPRFNYSSTARTAEIGQSVGNFRITVLDADVQANGWVKIFDNLNNERLVFDSTATYFSDIGGIERVSIDENGIVVTGDITCDDLFTSGDTIHVGTGEIKSTAGNVELYYDGTKTFETYTDGASSRGIILTDSASTLQIKGQPNIWEFINDAHGYGYNFKGENVGGTPVTMCTMDPDTGLVFYYGTIPTLKTHQWGLTVQYASAGSADFISTGAESGLALIRNNMEGKAVALRGNKTGPTPDTPIFYGSPDGAAELYHAGVKVFETDSTGITVIGTVTANDLKVDGDSILLGNTYLTEVPGGGLKVEGNLQVTGDLILDSTSALSASEVYYDNITPSTYNTVQDGIQTLGSAGLISGGVITSDGTAAVNVSAGTGMLRTSNDQFAPIEFIDFSAATGLAIPDDETKNIVVNYNGGSPEVQVGDVGAGNIHDTFILGQVGRAGDELFISNLRQRISNFAIRSLARLNGVEAVARDGNSGLIIGESADTNRYVTMTAGDVWTLLDLENISAFNSGTGDEFTTVYRDFPTGYIETPGETQWPADDYDDGTGTLSSLSNNRFGVRWFWYIPSSADMVMVYGTGNWKSLAEAEAEPVPTEVPGIITEYGILIGKIICQKNITIAAEVSSAFAETYNFSAATNHANLSNLTAPADDHTQYSLVTGTRDFTGTVGGVDPVAGTDFVTLQYMSTLGTDRTRLTYDGTTDLDISIEHIVDVKYTDFDITEDPPPWQEGRVFWDKDNNTFGVYNDVSDVTLQVGQETHIKIRNETGVLIPNGTICHISGSSGDRALVELADASDQEKTEGLVVVTHDLANNENGYGTIIGMVRGLDTIGYSDGEEIYLSETNPGEFRVGRPDAPNYVVDVGFVIVGDSTADGEILVSFINHGDFATLADVNVPTPPTNGQTLVYSEENMYWQPETQRKIISYTLPLTGVTDTVVPLTGTFVTNASGVTTDDATDYAISNQHVWILINSVTGADSTGTVTITGTSLSESTALPVTSDTEVITIDSTAGTYYQSHKKWWEITNIAISPDIAAINYDHGALGYPDMGNRNFKISGYRMDAFAAGNSPDMRLIISKVSDLGDKKVEFVDLEDIGVDSGAVGNQIIDHVRTGGDDRSYNPAVTDVWVNNTTFTFKQLDFDTYWTNDENEVLAAETDSGFFIRIEGEPDGGGITNVDYVNLLLYYALL